MICFLANVIMITVEDLVRVYKFACELKPICDDENLEIELMCMARPRANITLKFLTRSRRREYIRIHLQNMKILDPVIASMPTYKHLETWMSTGVTLEEQQRLHYT
jgi:hypothetical protein